MTKINYQNKQVKQFLTIIKSVFNHINILLLIPMGLDPMEELTIHLTPKEYDLLNDFQDQYYKVYGKMVTIEELFKQALFINSFKIKQKSNLKATKQTVLGGL